MWLAVAQAEVVDLLEAAAWPEDPAEVRVAPAARAEAAPVLAAEAWPAAVADPPLPIVRTARKARAGALANTFLAAATLRQRSSRCFSLHFSVAGRPAAGDRKTAQPIGLGG